MQETARRNWTKVAECVSSSISWPRLGHESKSIEISTTDIECFCAAILPSHPLWLHQLLRDYSGYKAKKNHPNLYFFSFGRVDSWWNQKWCVFQSINLLPQNWSTHAVLESSRIPKFPIGLEMGEKWWLFVVAQKQTLPLATSIIFSFLIAETTNYHG